MGAAASTKRAAAPISCAGRSFHVPANRQAAHRWSPRALGRNPGCGRWEGAWNGRFRKSNRIARPRRFHRPREPPARCRFHILLVAPCWQLGATPAALAWRLAASKRKAPLRSRCGLNWNLRGASPLVIRRAEVNVATGLVACDWASAQGGLWCYRGAYPCASCWTRQATGEVRQNKQRWR